MKKIRKIVFLAGIMLLCGGCGRKTTVAANPGDGFVAVDDKIRTLEDGLQVAVFEGEDGFETFLNNGGASSDGEVVQFLSQFLVADIPEVSLTDNAFGCSTLAVKNETEEFLFGRNFDWNNCEALILLSKPDQGYASISTVNMDFITQGAGAMSVVLLSENIRKAVALYAPLDGMNENGLCVSVNMIEDSETIEQNTEKPDITTTTAIRLLLNKAANVDEALELLEAYDLHASFGYMVHFAIADASGKHVVVEYVNNEMFVTDTAVVTNFYLAEGEKQGIGSSQSHTRYDILQETLAEKNEMSEDDVRDALDSVSKDNFGEFESTEWSIVFNQSQNTASYFHRENYGQCYRFQID